MSWFKIDDKFHSHPKALEAGNAAIGLWTRCGSWSADQLTDGFIPHAIASQYGTKPQRNALVSSRLWVPVEGGYQMHDWCDQNPTRDTVLSQRKANARRIADWRRNGGSNAVTEGVTNGVTNARVTASRPDPTRSTSRDLDTGPTDINAGRSRLVDSALAMAIAAEVAARDITRPIDNPERWAIGYRTNKLTERRTELASWLERNPAGSARALAVEVFGANPLYVSDEGVA